MNYCSQCAQPVALEVPAGDNRPRHVCHSCGHIHYENPRLVVGCVPDFQGSILLCRRAIEPRRGFWTVPAGFMELGETAEQAAVREAREEANAEIAIERLLAVYTIPRIAQVQIMYLARLTSATISPGPESLEVVLAGWGEIPWAELAFPSVRWVLEQYQTVQGRDDFAPFANPPGEFGDAKPMT